MAIVSLHNEAFKDLMKFKQKKYRNRDAVFLVEGEHLVKEAIANNVCLKVISHERLPYWDGDTLLMDQVLLGKLSDVETSDPVFALCRKQVPSKDHNRILILDSIQDPGNLGTLLRSARAFEFTLVVFENTVDIYNPKVIRATQGAIFKLDFLETGIIGFIEGHPEYLYIGTDVSRGKDLEGFPVPKGKIALILGNEGQGVRREILEKTKIDLHIRMAETESLNVGVAGSILMYHLRGE